MWDYDLVLLVFVSLRFRPKICLLVGLYCLNLVPKKKKNSFLFTLMEFEANLRTRTVFVGAYAPSDFLLLYFFLIKGV